jgi:hypothetical protein
MIRYSKYGLVEDGQPAHLKGENMSMQDAARKEYVANSILFVVMAILMAALILKTPAPPLRYLFLATPYVFLLSIWRSFHSASKKVAPPRDGSCEQRQATFQSLRSTIQMQTVFGGAGIAVALAMGFLLGRLGSH